VRVIAILAAYNEERFIASCLEHLIRQGVESYLIDNCSTDRTVSIAERYLQRGLIEIESFPRNGIRSWRPLLERKEHLASLLDADWFMHVDPDEIRLAHRSDFTLAEAFAEADAQGYNAVNFQEFTFIPTREAPDHDHMHFHETMRHYYAFSPAFPHRLNAWKRQSERVELAWSAGHLVRFPELRMYPTSFAMKHYMLLGVCHAVEKWVQHRFDPAALKAGWHGWRAHIQPERIKFPPQSALNYYIDDDHLDAANPRTRHFAEDWVRPERGWLSRLVRFK